MLLQSRGCRCLYFFVLILLDGTDLISDWLLYADVSLSEKGLVYGPPDESVIHALLAFSILGTVLFVFEVLNLWRGMFRGNPWFDIDGVAMVTIWLEDLPQIAINLYIAWCREDPISIFQLSKASIVLIGLLLRFLFLLVNYLHKRLVCEDNACRRRKLYRTLIMVGLVINALCAAGVFIFTQTQRQPSGDLKFQVPESVFEDRYDDRRYFQNVSVFVHHPDFDVYRANNGNNNHMVNWVRLMSINDIRNSDDIIHYVYIYQKTPTELRMALWTRVDQPAYRLNGNWDIRECGRMNLQDGSLAVVDTSTCQQSFITDPVNVYITFSFLKPGVIIRRRIFGDILYNIKVGNTTFCRDYNNITDNVNMAAEIPIIHYYRANASIDTTTSHFVMENGRARFFHNDKSDLIDVSELWSTGFWRCPSTGNMGPTLQRDIRTGCDNSS